MNILELQESLKDLPPDSALMQEMQMPSGLCTTVFSS